MKIGKRKRPPVTPAVLEEWARWLTGPRLERLNADRERTGEPPLTLPQAARYLATIDYVKLEEYKARIA